MAVLKFIAFEYDGFIKEEKESIRPFFATNTVVNGNIGRISIKSYKITGGHEVILLSFYKGGDGRITVITK